MPLWPAHPEPWPDTVEAALALPASWSVSEAFVKLHAGSPECALSPFSSGTGEYADLEYCSPERRALLIRSYISFLYNSFIPARWFK